MIDEEELKKARSRILRWLSYRSRSRREAELYLEKKGFSQTTVNAVIAEMEKYRYLDDQRFTEEYMQSSLRRGLGPHRVRIDLINKGVDREVINAGLARHFNPERDLARAVALVGKRLEHDSAPRDEKWLRRQVMFLKGRGFGEPVVIKALQHFYRGPVDETLS